jgi:c-di-GMP-binding flagellar brake protein YcgR
MTTMLLQQDRRADPRYHIDWAVSVSGDRAGRMFSGRGLDLSRGGALVVLPLSAPLRPGQEVQVRLQPRSLNMSAPETAPSSMVRNARIVRVQRGPRFLDGLQMVGLKFIQ